MSDTKVYEPHIRALHQVSIRYSTDSVLPADAVIEIGFPDAYTFNVGGTTALTVMTRKAEKKNRVER